MAESDNWLSVGKIVGVQGLQGELRVNPASDFPERFTAPGPRWLRSRKGGEPIEIQLNKGRQLPGKSLFVVRLEGIDSRSAAETLVGQELLVSADDRPELDEGEYHLLDLLGLEARLAADRPCRWHRERSDQRRQRPAGNHHIRRPQATDSLRGGDRAGGALGGGLAAAHPTARPAGALKDLSRGIDRTPWGERFWVTAFRT